MLLSSLSILMGAILVPSDYLWVYSTHIILMCLYLIHRKSLILICLTVLSLVVVIFSEFPDEKLLAFSIGEKVLVHFSNKELIISDIDFTGVYLESEEDDFSIVYVSEHGIHQTLNDFSLTRTKASLYEYNEEFGNRFLLGVIDRITLPDKHGPWWQRNLYIDRQTAQLRIQLTGTKLNALIPLNFSIRDQLFVKLDQAFSSFSSWRFSKALLLGRDDLWSERDVWIIRTLGLAHLFVVSGLHTGFMFVIGCLVSRLVWQWCPARLMLSGITRWHCDATVVIPILFGYAYLTEWGEPVVRASIMLSLYLCARMLALKFSAYSVVTFALWLILLVEPRSILSPGLWLSFSMVYLIIGFCQISTQLSRLLILQLMLTTASMVMILGWQEAISSGSIIMNISLIPFAALLWFPWGIISCLEVLMFDSTYSYSILDYLLTYLVRALEWGAFTLPLLFFETFSSAIPRIVMIFLVGFWVYQSPLKRGGISVIAIWFVLFTSMVIDTNKSDFSLLNKENELFLTNENSILLSDAWAGNKTENLLFGGYLDGRFDKGYMLSPKNIRDLSSEALLKNNVKWIVFKRKAPDDVVKMLNALQVDWLVISPDESLNFYFQKNQISLRHSACIYSFFLFKSDTCKRVEKLESVLNYTDT